MRILPEPLLLPCVRQVCALLARSPPTAQASAPCACAPCPVWQGGDRGAGCLAVLPSEEAIRGGRQPAVGPLERVPGAAGSTEKWGPSMLEPHWYNGAHTSGGRRSLCERPDPRFCPPLPPPDPRSTGSPRTSASCCTTRCCSSVARGRWWQCWPTNWGTGEGPARLRQRSAHNPADCGVPLWQGACFEVSQRRNSRQGPAQARFLLAACCAAQQQCRVCAQQR